MIILHNLIRNDLSNYNNNNNNKKDNNDKCINTVCKINMISSQAFTNDSWSASRKHVYAFSFLLCIGLEERN